MGASCCMRYCGNYQLLTPNRYLHDEFVRDYTYVFNRLKLLVPRSNKYVVGTDVMAYNQYGQVRLSTFKYKKEKRRIYGSNEMIISECSISHNGYNRGGRVIWNINTDTNDSDYPILYEILRTIMSYVLSLERYCVLSNYEEMKSTYGLD